MPTTGYNTDAKRPLRNWVAKGNAGRRRNLRIEFVEKQPGISPEEIQKRIKYGRY